MFQLLELYQQMFAENLSRSFRPLGIDYVLHEWIEERYSNNVCTSARFTFWSYFSSDLYQEISIDFVQTKHQVRIDSLKARRIKQKHLRMKRNDKTTGLAHALVVWQRRLIP